MAVKVRWHIRATVDRTFFKKLKNFEINLRNLFYLVPKVEKLKEILKKSLDKSQKNPQLRNA